MKADAPVVAIKRGCLAFGRDLWGVIALLLLWELWVWWNDFNAIVMPHPAAIARDLIENPGLYGRNAAQTFGLALCGLAMGLVIGTGLAILTWTSATLAGLLTPMALVFASVPVVALIPVLARLFGYDLRTVLVIVAIISFFPSFVFTSAGLRALPAGSADLFVVSGATTWRRLTLLAIPAALPNWMIAFRLAAANSILAAMVAEFLMGVSGLGNLFHAASNDLDMPRALGASLVAMAIAVTLYGVTAIAEARIHSRWQA